MRGASVVSDVFTLGLIINPYAGIGGAVAMKGSDGPLVREEALKRGATLKAQQRAEEALSVLLPYRENIKVITVSGNMGASLCQKLELDYQVAYHTRGEQTESDDTEAAAVTMLQYPIDLLLFAGGDGTARNICSTLGDQLPVLGIPAGCKIHSGVYGVTPRASGLLVEKMLQGELVTISDADVMDIDEQLFRQGVVKAKAYGEMKIPKDLSYVQAVKAGGKESDELVLHDIAEYVMDEMEDQHFIMGSGSTVDAIMQRLQLKNTLLGVDVIHDQVLLENDVTAAQLETLVTAHSCRLVITLIGGQGHIFGRGNQQLSPSVIRAIGKENIWIVASKKKLQALNGRPLIADTGDPALDVELAGSIEVITGYNDRVLYRIGTTGVE